VGKLASQYRPRSRRDLGRPREGEFSEARMAYRPILKNEDEKKKKKKKKRKRKSKQCVTFSVNVEFEYLDILLYTWKTSG
jgi:hypothetical protein